MFTQPGQDSRKRNSEGRTGSNELSQRNERATYIMLLRTDLMKHGIA